MVSLRQLASSSDSNGEGILSRVKTTISESSITQYAKQAAADSGYVSKKLLASTGKAAWIAGTTFLILVLPLIIEMDRDQQLAEIEVQQQTLLGPPPTLTSS
ncbi:hypothetical protein ACFE04_013882 [Oxalis oulophora]